MRDIKFRAWDKRAKEMGYSGKVLDEDDNLLTSLSDFFKVWCEQMDGKLSPTVILMQYIGLKDKNGKEIYEGDILRYGSKRDNIILQFVWNSVSDCGFKILRQKNKNVVHDIRMYRFDEQAKVIGNIYENPEKLKTTHPTR